MDTIEQALDVLKGCRAVVVGDLMLDAYVYGETVRVSREAPVIVVRRERTEHRLGGAANTAANLTALGVHTELVGVAGNDESSHQMCHMLEERGAVTDSMVRDETATIPVKTRIMAGAFGTVRQQVLRLDDELERGQAEGFAPRLAERLAARGAHADLVIVSDYGQGLMTEPVAAAAAQLAQQGTLVFVDSRYNLQQFAGVTAATPNVPEAEMFVGHSLATKTDIQEAGQAILGKLGVQACLITQGRGGMTLFESDGGVSHVPIVGDEEVTDVTGAGDTVIAVFGAAVAAGLGMRNAMRLANCAAGIVVTRVGTVVAKPAEIVAAAMRYGMELEPWAGSVQ